MVPFDPPAEMVLTRSVTKEVDPVGVPNVRGEPFCTCSVAPLGADDAPSTANASPPSPRTASSTRGIRLRRGTRQKLVGRRPPCGRAAPSGGGGASLQGGSVRLTRPQQRQVVEALDLLGRLELRHAPAGEPPPALLEVERSGGFHEGGDPPPQERVRIAHRDGMGGVGMGFESAFDLRGQMFSPPRMIPSL